MRPPSSEYLEYFDRYISLVPGDRVVPVLRQQMADARVMFDNIAADQAGFRYAPDKWSVREVLGHVTDTERVFGYRALWFARGGIDALPGFDQEPFVAAARHDGVPIGELLDEFLAVRASHLLMFEHLAPGDWAITGSAGGHPMSVRAAAFVIAGHFEHHRRLLAERYRVPA